VKIRTNLEVTHGKDGKVESVKVGGTVLPVDEARRRGILGPVTDGRLGHIDGAAHRSSSTQTYRSA
jgi:hypothetical protein